jgi:hypothetical protein
MAKLVVEALDEGIELGVGAPYLNRPWIIAGNQRVVAALKRFIN